MVGTPRRSNSARTTLLPVAMPPVRAMRFIPRNSAVTASFAGDEALFHERVPLVAVRALPEQLRAAVAAAHADVRIEVEHRASRELACSAGPAPVEVQREQRLPDCLVNGQAVRVVRQRVEQQIERLRCRPAAADGATAPAAPASPADSGR